MAQILRRIVLGLVCLLIVAAIATGTILASTQPSLAQVTPRFSLGQSNNRVFVAGDLEFTSIHLDGEALFQIAAHKASPVESETEGNLTPLERRVRRVESTLRSIVYAGFDPKTLAVRSGTLNGLTVIIASDQSNLVRQVILTVTEIDAQIASSSIEDLAQQWSQTLHQSLLQAWQARQPEARKRQITTGVKIVLGMTSLSSLLLWCQRLLKNRFNTLKKRATKRSSPTLKSPNLAPGDTTDLFFSEPLTALSAFHHQANLQQQLIVNILLQRLDQIGLILLWFGGVAAILYTFPETRLEGLKILFIPLKIFIIWFVLTLITNLTGLYVNHWLEEWVEQAPIVSEDPQRRILRAPTLLEVSRGIIGFAAWCVGIIWFLIWNGFFPSSFLTGAGLLGAALTFAFQNLLKDWINGILIITEDQYAVGDLIEFGGLIGMVEQMSLRASQIRLATDGRLSTIPHNQITIAHNLTRDWSRVHFTIEVAYDTDSHQAIALMKQVAEAMAVDPQWQKDIIDPVITIGINHIAHSGMELMMRIQVKRLRQFDVEREFRRRLKLAFDEQGIQIGVPQQRFLMNRE